MMLNFNSTEKKQVMTTDGKIVGVMAGCVVDNTNWSVVTLSIELSKEVSDFLGTKGTMLKSPVVGINPSRVGTVGDAVMLNVSLGDLRGQVEEMAAQKKGFLSGI
jgi:sporulation protein YlmC with PRC-barrel domain